MLRDLCFTTCITKKMKHTIMTETNTKPWASLGGKTGICSPLEIGNKNKNFLEIMKAVAKIRLIEVILAVAVTVYLPL